jgi:hypothetical protein
MAFCCASRWSAEVPKPVKSRSAASDPHCLLKAVRKTHALPRCEQAVMASFSALARSSLPCDHPAPISALLYAIAPQEVFFGGLGALGGAALAFGAEQTHASTAHFFPPARLHSASDRCSAFNFVASVPQVTISPSAATAPHAWLKLASTEHLTPPDLVQYCTAIFSAVALSTCSNDQPETLSFLL